MSMKSMEAKVHEWYLINIKPEELDKKIKATLEYIKRIEEPEDGSYTIWAFEVVDGHHGQYTIKIFLTDVLNEDSYMKEENLDVLMEKFDEVSHVVSNNFNRFTKLTGEFHVGHNEADGSLGLFYTEKA